MEKDCLYVEKRDNLSIFDTNMMEYFTLFNSHGICISSGETFKCSFIQTLNPGTYLFVINNNLGNVDNYKLTVKSVGSVLIEKMSN